MTVDEVIADIEEEKGSESAVADTTPTTNPFLIKAARNKKVQNLEKARAAKVEKREQESQAALEDQRRELESIDDKITKADEDYVTALQAATKIPGYDEKLWKKADTAQQTLLNLLARKRILEAKLKPRIELETPAEPVQTEMTLVDS